MDENNVTRSEFSLFPQSVLCRDEGFWDRRRFTPTESLRNLGNRTLLCDEVLGVGPASRDAEDPLARFPQLNQRSNRDDFSGKFDSGNVLWKSEWGRIVSLALQQICLVECGGLYVNQDLIRSRRWLRNVADLKYLWTARPGDDHRLHAGSLIPLRILCGLVAQPCHLTTTLSAAPAILDTLFHLLIIASNCFAALSTFLAYFCADTADLIVIARSAEHKVCRHLTNFRTIKHHANMLCFRMFSPQH